MNQSIYILYPDEVQPELSLREGVDLYLRIMEPPMFDPPAEK
jgi:hypothetical protein